MKKSSNLFGCLIFLLFLLYAPFLHAENAEIGDLLITNNATHLLVYARVMNCFTSDMETEILAGIPTTFTILVDLYQVRKRWLDKKLIRLTIRHTIKYDNVKRLFYVSSNGDKEPASFADYESAKRAMAALDGFPVTQLTALNKGEAYYVEVKAKLDKVRLPLHMEYVFFFVSFWDFETGWRKEGFVY